MQNKPVRLERSGDVARIIVDHKPYNALSHPVRLGLLDALAEFEADSQLRAAVLTGAGPTFIADADAPDPEDGPREATLHLFLRALDACRKPVVAAINGAAFGRGLETALACHARIIAPDAVVCLPAVRLGLIPGAGGTQRLPRLVGPLVALDLITTGRRVEADEAMTLGLVDEVATDLDRAALDYAHRLVNAGALRRLADRSVPHYDHAAFEAAAATVERRARGALAPLRALEAIRHAITLPLVDGLTREETLARELRAGPQTVALRHLAHAEHVAARPTVKANAWPVRQVGVVGGGTMGSGIAVALADAGLEVTLVEADAAAEAAARTRVQAVYQRQLRGGRLTDRLYQERTGRIAYASELKALRHADLVIEAVVEDLDIKCDVFRALSGIVRRDALLASNTSYLDIDVLADVVDAPERVLGLHFFSPAHVMRLVEVVRTRRVWPEALATALATVQRMRKQPVVAGVCDGFIGNRILGKWRAQAEYALEDGASPQQVDAALEAYGMAMGIFAVFDLAGLDVDWRDRKRKATTRDKRERYVPVFDWICELGRYGQKTGRGFYLHEGGKRVPDPEVQAMAERAATARGIVRRPVSAEEIQQRIHAAMVNEGARVLSEGIAARPSDIDVVLVHGYGYPAWRGGPMHEADVIGIREMLRRIEVLHTVSGVGWEPAPLLREMAAAGKRFADLNG